MDFAFLPSDTKVLTSQAVGIFLTTLLAEGEYHYRKQIVLLEILHEVYP
jgi:hypothetical protein